MKSNTNMQNNSNRSKSIM